MNQQAMEHLEEAFVALRGMQKEREAMTTLLTATENQTHGLCRNALDFSVNADEETRDEIKKEAKKLKKHLWKGAECSEHLEEKALGLSGYNQTILSTRQPLIDRRNKIERMMAKLVEPWPIYQGWVTHVRGFGPKTLAAFIGYNGDLHKYPTPSALWRANSLHVLWGHSPTVIAKKPEVWIAAKDGVSPKQYKAMRDADRGADKNADTEYKRWKSQVWRRINYSPRRMKVCLFDLGASLMKGNGNGEHHGFYKETVYDERRELTAEKYGDDEGWPNDRQNKDAIRITAKQCIADLWGAWRHLMPVSREAAEARRGPDQVTDKPPRLHEEWPEADPLVRRWLDKSMWLDDDDDDADAPYASPDSRLIRPALCAARRLC